MTDFKIGDIVIFTGISDDSIRNGAVCEIVADKETPFKMSNPLATKEVYPRKDNDFVINEFATDEEISRSVLKSLISVSKTEIVHHKKS